MKKGTKLAIALAFILAFVFALSLVSFASSTESNEYGELDTVEGVTEPSVIDKNARTVVVVNGTYYTIPTYYLIKDNETFTWSVPTAVREAFGITLSKDRDIRSYIVRVEIPENITKLQNHEDAFRMGGSTKNTTLVAVTFPSTLTDLGIGSFNQCTALTSADLSHTKITVLRSDTGATYNNNSGVFSSCSSLTSIKLPSTITRIEKWAATTCSSLAEVVIPADAKINHIGQYAFEKSVITSFYFSSELAELGTGAFFECKKLTTLENFENTKLESVPYRAFSSAPLTTLYLPSTLTSIEEDAFKSHKIKQDSLVIPNSVTTIGKCAFAGSSRDNVSIGELVLPANLTTLGNYAFEKNSAKVIYFPASMTSVPEGMFKDFCDTFLFVFVGSKSQLDALIPNINNNSNYNGRLSIDAAKTIKSIDEYGKIVPSAVSGKSMVYGVNHCDAFYGEHLEGSEETGAWLGDKFLSNYQITCPCGRNCGVVTVVKELEPLFTTKGYSTSGTAMMQAFAINKSLWESEYSVLFPELKYGMVAAFNGVNTEAGFDTTSGKIVNTDCTGINNKVAVCDMTERGFDIFEIKISGVGADNYKETSFFLCAYIVLDGQVYYINNGTTSDSATGVSYSDVADIVYPDYGFITTGKEE